MLRAFLKGVVAEWSWYDKLFLFGGIFLLVLGILAFLSPRLRQLVGTSVKTQQQELPEHNGREFYLTRGELVTVRKKMSTELKGATKIWIATWIGRYFLTEELFSKYHVDRLLLLDPYSQYAKIHTGITGADEDVFVNSINDVAKLAQKSDTIVRFADFPIMDFVMIVDKECFRDENKFTDDAWIRVETAIPFGDPNNCPNFVVYNKGEENQEWFKALVKHYNLLWGKGRPEPTPRTRTEVYPTSDKLTLVVRAIAEAQQITPKNKDITVYVKPDSMLNSMYAEELRDILFKLQDEKAIILKEFPNWMLSSQKTTQEGLSKQIEAYADPSKKNFIVRTLSKFEKLLK